MTALPALNSLSAAYACLVGTAAFGHFRRQGNTLAEAGAYGLMAMIMLQSWMAQVLLLAGCQVFLPVAHGVATAAALPVVWRHRRLLRDQLRAMLRFVAGQRPACGILAAGFTALAATGLFRAAHADIPALIPAGLSVKDTLFNAVRHSPEHALFALNHAALLAGRPHAFTAAMANQCALLSIALCTYALARRYAWPPTALTVALLVVSMPRIALQSQAVYSELGPAAAALLCMVALYRTVEEPHVRDAAMLLGGIAFCVSGGRLCYLMPTVLLALSLMVLSRRHDLRLWPRALRRHLFPATVTAAVVLVFSQLPVIALNLTAGKAWIGELAPDTVRFNADGLWGLAANLVRYACQCLHFPHLFDRFSQWALGFSPPAVINGLYTALAAPVFNGKGAAAPFAVAWRDANGGGWFGPVGFLLVLPSLGYALRKGPRRLKTIAMALGAYWVLVSLIAAWHPSNARLMTPFFACAGFAMAFFLPPWRLGRKGRFVLQLLSIVLLAVDLMV